MHSQVHPGSLEGEPLEHQGQDDSGSTGRLPGNAERGQRILNPVMVAVLLTAAVLVLDVVLPGLPGAERGLIGRLSVLMSGICPQRPSHSYTLGSVQLPLEARMLGMFGGLTVGMLYLGTFGRKRMYRWPRLPLALVLVLGVGIMAFDGFNALFFDLHWPHAYTPDLRLRLGTGILTGIAMAFFLVPALAQVGKPGAETGTPPGWRDLGWVTLGSIGFVFLVASGWRVLLAPVALIAVGGVVLAWMTINRVVLWGLTGARPIASARTWRHWLLDILAAGLAVGELVLLALLFSNLREALLPQ